jgi:hypothetical protein
VSVVFERVQRADVRHTIKHVTVVRFDAYRESIRNEYGTDRPNTAVQSSEKLQSQGHEEVRHVFTRVVVGTNRKSRIVHDRRRRRQEALRCVILFT